MGRDLAPFEKDSIALQAEILILKYSEVLEE
jgi:hypothetical protein